MTFLSVLFNNLSDLMHKADATVYVYLNSFAGGDLLDRIVREEEGNSLIKGGVFLAPYWYFWFRPGPRQKQQRSQIVATVLAVFGAIVVARVLADVLPFRVRPMYDPRLPHGTFAVLISPNMENWSAFPSDMAAYFVGLAVGLLLLSRAAGVPLLLFAAVWVCMPWLYIGLHYLSDIVAGAALAAVLVCLAPRSRWLRENVAARTARLAEAYPAAFYSFAFLFSMEMANTFSGIRSLMHGAASTTHLTSHHTGLIVALVSLPLLAVMLGLYTAGSRRRSLADRSQLHRI
jgi:undecaprenyl-diphosphatase